MNLYDDGIEDLMKNCDKHLDDLFICRPYSEENKLFQRLVDTQIQNTIHFKDSMKQFLVRDFKNI